MDAPEWVDSGAVATGGLDLLGLRLPVQVIGRELLDGVTTVTPRIRYLAIRAWLIQRYAQSGLPDSAKHFSRFALRLESALVLANLIEDRRIGGLIGANQALIRLDASTTSVALSALVKSPAATIYATPSIQLGFTDAREDILEDAAPALTRQRGLPLAQLLDRRLSGAAIVQRLLDNQTLVEATVDELRALGAVARIDQIPDDERVALLAGLLPVAPLKRERPRLATYAALLTLARTIRATPTEHHLFAAACAKARFGEPSLDAAADGWVRYCVRDAIAATQEAVLSALMTEITTRPGGGRDGVDRATIIRALMERVDEHSAALQALGLLAPAESVSTLSFRQLWSRMDRLLSPGLEHRHGLSRWDSPLTEAAIYSLAFQSGAGALSLAVVAWLLARLRIASTGHEGGRTLNALSLQGGQRLGLRDVVLPELQRFYREDRPLRDVAAELAYRTVHQHLQIAWSRLQGDLRRDVALLTTDGDQWRARGKGFRGGRTASRLQQALGWLEQLRLIDAGGITADGEVARQAALRALTAEGPA